jgi:hypothetical protein
MPAVRDEFRGSTVPGIVVLRMAGVPVCALGDLRAAPVWATVRHVLDPEERLRRTGPPPAEALPPVIGALGDSPARSWLVGLRRALQRSPSDGTGRRGQDRAAVVAARPGPGAARRPGRGGAHRCPHFARSFSSCP